MLILFRNIIILFSIQIGGAMADKNTQIATFAGGCFWCIEAEFEKVDGIISAISGYTGGEQENPTYKQVSGGDTGHIESVQITFNSHKISYEDLLEIYWKNIDPEDDKGQFCDKGFQYSSAIFYHNDSQYKSAKSSKEALQEKLGISVKTIIQPIKIFYQAENYHQDYHKKNPIRYKFYRNGCGRDKRLKEIWKDFSS